MGLAHNSDHGNTASTSNRLCSKGWNKHLFVLVWHRSNDIRQTRHTPVAMFLACSSTDRIQRNWTRLLVCLNKLCSNICTHTQEAFSRR